MIAIKSRAICALLIGATGLFLHSIALAVIPIQHWVQPGGAQVYLIESPAIPMVDVQIDFDAGGRRDPAAQAGLASVTAGMLDKGVLAGNGERSAGPPRASSAPSGGSAVREATSVGAIEPALDESQLNEAWADLGAQFGAGAGSDRMSFSLRSLTEPDLLAKAVALAAREIAEPAFPDSVWQRERQRMQAALKESYTRPGNVIGRAYTQAVYGSHPYGYEVSEATLAQISVADMRAAHAAGVVACRARISLVGAITRAQADAMATSLLSRLPQVPCASLAPLPAVAEVAPLSQAKETSIPFDSAQAHVLIGQPGFKRDDPDYFPLTVGNYILGGGGFVSRLTVEVREKRGLTYGVSSGFTPGRHAGSFTVGLQTRPDQATQAAQLVHQVLSDFVAQGPTEAELKAAKDNLIGGFALRIDSNSKLLSNLASIAWNNLPLDYLERWTQQVDKVTVADIKAAFARKLQPEKMVTVILGAAS
ncbi:zinc protease [Polaromonas sp. OV174]|uniref:M16 family metallopeptidase n=1 Tax=Polaromonas sp. OV174 TaxID=1855300 RepID=UPI0008EA1E74|nr:pitrilysin family protein [Polaromonas sp. OV174]SFC51595.1 zinc protease [Polaromonas sp. OV174]